MANSSAQYIRYSIIDLLDVVHQFMHMMGVLVDVALPIPMSNMDGLGIIQSLLPADMRAMEMCIFPWNELLWFDDLAMVRPQ